MTNINVVFKGGNGKLTAKLDRNGALIDQGSIDKSGTISLQDAISGDSIGIDGECSGTADVNISVTTNPTTPQQYLQGEIHDGFDV